MLRSGHNGVRSILVVTRSQVSWFRLLLRIPCYSHLFPSFRSLAGFEWASVDRWMCQRSLILCWVGSPRLSVRFWKGQGFPLPGQHWESGYHFNW